MNVCTISGRREGRKMFMLYHSETVLGWRVIRMVNLEKGRAKVAAGEWRAIHDEFTGELIGFQPIAGEEQRGDRDMPSQYSPATISAAEMQANAGELGRSRTAGLAELDRIGRRDRLTGHLLPAEDFIERAVAKIRVFPNVGAAKGDILRAWPK